MRCVNEVVVVVV